MRRPRPRLQLVLALGLSLAAGCRPSAPDPQLVGQWVRTSLAFARSEQLGPPVAARISAYASIALYEGYAADPHSRLRSLAGQVNGLWSVPVVAGDRAIDGATVAAEAERVVLDSLFSEGFPGTRRTIDSLAAAQIEARRRAGVKGDLRERSLAHGRALARAILAWAATDGFFATRGRVWQAPSSASQWVNAVATNHAVVTSPPRTLGPKTTLPRFDPLTPTEPYWGSLRPFALRNGDECAPPVPPTYSQRPGSSFWKMGKEFYDSVRTLEAEKKAIALFWADNPVATGTPGFHWISVANQMTAMRHLRADQAAEAYMLTSVAIADAFIGCWKEMYRSLVVRPVTFVHRVFEAKWNTEVATPPFPEYPSGHSTVSGAAAEVLITLLGDSIPFTDSTQVDIGAPARSYRNFTHALDEAAISPVYGGIHYMPAAVFGTAQGKCIGQRVLGRLRTRVGRT